MIRAWSLDTADFPFHGAEHHVAFAGFDMRVDKLTGIADNYDIDEGIDPLFHGATMVFDPVTERPIPGEYRNNSPIGYLARMAWQNELFLDGVRLESFNTSSGSFHISQPFYTPVREGELTYPEIFDWACSHDWLPLIEDDQPRNHIFLHEESQVLATDLRPPNFGRRPDQSLIPFDPVLLPIGRLFPDF